MAVSSTLTQLENVQAAISALETGAQSYRIGDVSVTKASLSTLYAREKTLLVRYRREQKGKSRIRLDLSAGI